MALDPDDDRFDLIPSDDEIEDARAHFGVWAQIGAIPDQYKDEALVLAMQAMNYIVMLSARLGDEIRRRQELVLLLRDAATENPEWKRLVARVMKTGEAR